MCQLLMMRMMEEIKEEMELTLGELSMGHQVIGEEALMQLVGWLSINVKYLLFQRALFKLGVTGHRGIKVSGSIISLTLGKNKR